MNIETKISNFIARAKFIVPLLFALMLTMFVTLVVLIVCKDVTYIHPNNAFSVGGELCAMIVAIMMSVSILPTYKRHDIYNRIFVTLLTVGCLALFLDSLQLIYDGDPIHRTLNNVTSVFIYVNSSLYLFFFWIYASKVLSAGHKGKILSVLNLIALFFLVINFIVPFFNFVHPFYFYINDAGYYTRITPMWYLSQNFVVYLIIAMFIGIVTSKARVKSKLIISAFAILPLIAIFVAGYAKAQDGDPTVSVQYSAMMASLVLIYAFLFSDNERNLHSKNKELSIATNIQKNMLPCIFPAFPERKEFDIYASMVPAKEVGGDFYDFFLIDENNLGLVMADVSDKGIPAALFMMSAKIMVENYAMQGQSPKEVMTSVNKEICSRNQDGMFVTIWFGIFNIRTGVLTACNAGHENPIIKHADGHFEMFKDKHCFVIGWNEMAVYKEYEVILEKGAKIFVYTDGVPESYNGAEQFGYSRTLKALIEKENESPKDILTHVQESINTFVNNRDQFDDTTMLCLEYKGYNKETMFKSYKIPATVEALETALDPVIIELEDIEASHKDIYRIRLSLDEVLTNVVSYAYKDKGQGEIEIKYNINMVSRVVTICVIDNGVPFNPLEVSDPDISKPASERKIGGLGLYIVKKNMDEIDYRRENNQNILVMRKKI